MKAAVRLLICLGLVGSVKCAWTTDPPEPITLSEAEILIYLMPVCQQLRQQGFDVSWDLERSSDHADSFRFQIFNAKRKCPKGCSVTVGYFAVNKRTAEVQNLDTEKILDILD